MTVAGHGHDFPEARIIAIADVVDAMSATRAHRPAPGLGAALHELRERRGQLYVPTAVDACVRLFGENALRSRIRLRY